MRHLPLILLFILPTLLTAQRRIGFSAGPTYSYRSLNPESGAAERIADLRAENESPAVGYQAEVYYRHPVGDRISLGLGVRYDHRPYNLSDKDEELRWGSQHDGDGGFDPSLPPGEQTDNFRLTTYSNFVGLPLFMNYTLTRDGAVQPFIRLSAIPAYHLTTTHGPSEVQNRIHLFARLTGGLLVPLSESLNLTTQFGLERDFVNVYGGSVNEKLQGLSLQIGLERSL